MKRIVIPVVIVAVVAVFIGIYVNYHQQQTQTAALEQFQTATVLSQAREIAEFNLSDNKHNHFSNKDLLGHWSMIFFGFTNCGHICPTTMAALKNMAAILQQKKIQPPQVILISIDPKRDTVKQLNRYVTAYNPAFIGLTGSHKKIEALAKNLNILYMQVQPKTNVAENNNDSYDIDHSGTILLINPTGKLAAIFSMPHQPEEMAHDFELIQKYATK